jgi:hypothetical protein
LLRNGVFSSAALAAAAAISMQQVATCMFQTPQVLLGITLLAARTAMTLGCCRLA